MDWRDAFLAQARSDFSVFMQLNSPSVAYCHRLHFFQMATEKLGKSLAIKPHSKDAPKTSHLALVAMLRLIRTQRFIQQGLGFANAAAFAAYLDSLLEIASRVERLAPNFSGLHAPNPEYPWQDKGTNEVISPSEFAFAEFLPQNPKIAQLQALISNLLRIMN